MESSAPIVKYILDAGPLIAALNTSDTFHDWAAELFDRLPKPFFSCSEAMAEAAAMTGNPLAIVDMIRAGDIVLDFDLGRETEGVMRLLTKYRDVQMDLADACIVRMSEQVKDCSVLTVDRRDFSIYRRNGRDRIPLITPD